MEAPEQLQKCILLMQLNECVAWFHDYQSAGKFCVPLCDGRLNSAGLIQQGGVGWELWSVGIIWVLLIMTKL